MIESIGIIGAGAWGTALASVAARAGLETLIWAREAEVVSSINEHNRNSLYLPDVTLPNNVIAISDVSGLNASDAVIMAAPAQFVRATCDILAKQRVLNPGTPILIAAKGIENNTNALMHAIIEQHLPGHPIAMVSGPTFAAEVAKGKYTALSLACADQKLGGQLIDALSLPQFVLRYNDDVVGTEIGGAVKNVLAIGCGIVAGLGGGDNTVAAAITAGLHEMALITEALGGKRTTLMELCGMGDLVLTCSSMQSRNMSLGFQLGQGKSLEMILSERTSVAEGVATAKSVHALATEQQLSLPLCDAVYKILYERAAADTLMTAMR